MNIKSLLLGSAAALLAVSGARAADAVVVAEPEPMEYVRICDVYGAGFYYIPGTETCLKLSGMIRYDAAFSSYSDEYADDLGKFVNGDFVPKSALNDGWAKQLTARVRADARSETEYGTFRRFIELSAGGGAVQEATFSIRNAYIELGGLMVGHTDTLWDGAIPGELDEGGGSRVNQIRYSFDAGNGISVALSAEEPTYNNDYVPNIVGKVSVAQGWGGVDLFAAYDSGFDGHGNASKQVDDSWSLKATTTFKASDAVTLGLLAAYSSEDNDFTPQGFWGGSKWTVAGSVGYQVNEKLSLSAGAQYFGDTFGTNGDDNWAIGANVDYKVVQNLLARVNVKYEDGDSFYDGGATSGYFRLEAAF